MTFWFDQWLVNDYLAQSLRLVSYSGFGVQDKVSSLTVNNSWNLPTSSHHIVLRPWNIFDQTLAFNVNLRIGFSAIRLDSTNVKAATIWLSIRQSAAEVE